MVLICFIPMRRMQQSPAEGIIIFRSDTFKYLETTLNDNPAGIRAIPELFWQDNLVKPGPDQVEALRKRIEP